MIWWILRIFVMWFNYYIYSNVCVYIYSPYPSTLENSSSLSSLNKNIYVIQLEYEWPTTWTQSLVITLPKKGNLKLCQNYQTLSLISHPSKVMLKILLNRLRPQPEKIIAEKQAGFRAEHLVRNTSNTKKVFTIWSLTSKSHLRVACSPLVNNETL
jgi:hypothetical protein